MSEILSEQELCDILTQYLANGAPERAYLSVVESHRALQAKLAAAENEIVIWKQANAEWRELAGGDRYADNLLKHHRTEQQQRITALENAIRNEPELPGEIPQEMFETIKTLDKQGIEEWCRIIVRKTKESILRNAEPTETKAAS